MNDKQYDELKREVWDTQGMILLCTVFIVGIIKQPLPKPIDWASEKFFLVALGLQISELF